MYEIVVIDINGDRHVHVAEDFDTDEAFLYIQINAQGHRLNYNLGNIISWSHRDIDDEIIYDKNCMEVTK